MLTEAGVAPERADLVARLAGGRLDRARALDGRLAGVRGAFVATAAALDGSGSAVAAHVAAVQAAMQDAMTELDTAQAEEVASLTAELEQAGLSGSGGAHPAAAPRRPTEASTPARPDRAAVGGHHRARDRATAMRSPGPARRR